MTFTGMTLEEALRATENREHWRMVVRDAAKPRIEDGWRTEQNRWPLQCNMPVHYFHAIRPSFNGLVSCFAPLE